MAWIVEKYAAWTDSVRDGIRHPENAIERDVLLDIVTHYWMTNTGGSSARLYWESFTEGDYRPCFGYLPLPWPAASPLS